VELHRHNAVRAELLRFPLLALRLVIASTISREGNWSVKPETYRAAIADAGTAGSYANSKGKAAFDQERNAICALIDVPADGATLLGPDAEDVDCATLFARLIGMNDADVLRVAAFLMAESLPVDSDAVEALGHILNIDMDQWWEADEAFFALLRDKPALNAMLSEIAGKSTAFLHIKDTAKLQKDAIRHCLAGTGGYKKAEHWKPRYFRFPMQAYTKRRGLPAVDKAKRILKLFDKAA